MDPNVANMDNTLQIHGLYLISIIEYWKLKFSEEFCEKDKPILFLCNCIYCDYFKEYIY